MNHSRTAIRDGACLAMMLCLAGTSLSCGLISQNVAFPTNFNQSVAGSTSINPVTGQCTMASAGALESLAMSGGSSGSACGDSNSYDCESTTFSPSATALSKGAVEQCADVAGMGHVCLTVDTAIVPTSSSNPRTIFHCSNTKLTGGSGFLFQARASTLESALEGAVGKCQSRRLQ